MIAPLRGGRRYGALRVVVLANGKNQRSCSWLLSLRSFCRNASSPFHAVFSISTKRLACLKLEVAFVERAFVAKVSRGP